jgi:hypothetical protein
VENVFLKRNLDSHGRGGGVAPALRRGDEGRAAVATVSDRTLSSWPVGRRFLGLPFGHPIDSGQILIALSGFKRLVEPGGYGLGDC